MFRYLKALVILFFSITVTPLFSASSGAVSVWNQLKPDYLLLPATAPPIMDLMSHTKSLVLPSWLLLSQYIEKYGYSDQLVSSVLSGQLLPEMSDSDPDELYSEKEPSDLQQSDLQDMVPETNGLIRESAAFLIVVLNGGKENNKEDDSKEDSSNSEDEEHTDTSMSVTTLMNDTFLTSREAQKFLDSIVEFVGAFIKSENKGRASPDRRTRWQGITVEIEQEKLPYIFYLKATDRTISGENRVFLKVYIPTEGFKVPIKEDGSSYLADKVFRESEAIRQLCHSNIISGKLILAEPEQDEEQALRSKAVIFILEYAGHSLDSILKGDLIRDAFLTNSIKILTDVLEGLIYLEGNDKIHTDLKLDTIVVRCDKNRVDVAKLTGISGIYPFKKICQSPEKCEAAAAFQAPESVSEVSCLAEGTHFNSPHFSHKSTVYSFAIIMQAMIWEYDKYSDELVSKNGFPEEKLRLRETLETWLKKECTDVRVNLAHRILEGISTKNSEF